MNELIGTNKTMGICVGFSTSDYADDDGSGSGDRTGSSYGCGYGDGSGYGTDNGRGSGNGDVFGSWDIRGTCKCMCYTYKEEKKILSGQRLPNSLRFIIE